MSKSLASGSYGCVFGKGLPCADSDYQCEEECISKLMDPYNAQIELENNSTIDDLDPGYRWHVPILHKCPLAKGVRTDCHVENAKVQLFYPRLPYTMEDYFNGSPVLSDVAPALLSVWEGLLTLSNNGYIHFDIKTVNLMGNQVPLTRVFIIDYGLLTDVLSLPSLSAGSPLDKTSDLGRIYAFHPPETFFYDFRGKNFPRSFAKQYLDDYFVKDMLAFLEITLDEAYDTVEASYYKWINLSLDEQKQLIIERTDIFGLAYVLKKLYGLIPNEVSTLKFYLRRLVRQCYHLDITRRSSIQVAYPLYRRFVEQIIG